MASYALHKIDSTYGVRDSLTAYNPMPSVNAAVHFVFRVIFCLLRNKNDSLKNAVINGDAFIARQLLKAGADINIKDDEKGSSLLHLAARSGRHMIIELLLEQDPTLIEEQDEEGATALSIAAENEHVLAVEALLNARYQEARIEGLTPLHIAAEANYTSESVQEKVIELLINNDNSLLNAVTEKGLTPLHIAAYRGRKSAVSKLLDLGANIDARVGEKMMTVLYLAASAGKVDTIEHLVTERKAFVEWGVLKTGFTPLHVAIENGHLDAVIKLIELGANVWSTDWEHGFSVLDFAASSGREDIINHLNTALILVNQPAKDGLMPLHIAVYLGHIDAVRGLLKSGANPKVVDRDSKFTVLHFAVLTDKVEESKKEELIEFLLQWDRSLLNERSAIGQTALDLAVNLKNEPLAKKLLELGALDEHTENGVSTATWLQTQEASELEQSE